MTPPVATLIGDAFPGSGIGGWNVSLSWAADTILVAMLMAHRNTGDFSLGFSAGTSGLTWQALGSGAAHSTFSIGHGRGLIRLAKPAGAGSGTVGGSVDATCQQRGLDVWEVTGCDLSGADALAAVVQDGTYQLTGAASGSALGCTLDQESDADNIQLVNAGSIISDFSIDEFTTEDVEYTGSGGQHLTAWANEVLSDFTLDPVGGVGGPWAVFAELLGPATPEPEGWPEAFVGMQAI